MNFEFVIVIVAHRAALTLLDKFPKIFPTKEGATHRQNVQTSLEQTFNRFSKSFFVMLRKFQFRAGRFSSRGAISSSWGMGN
jgi:hypothetical protein